MPEESIISFLQGVMVALIALGHHDLLCIVGACYCFLQMYLAMVRKN